MNPAYQFVAAAAGTLAFGLALVFLPQALQPLWNLLFFGSFGTPDWMNAQAALYLGFLHAVMGAVLVGWAALLLWLGLGPLRRGEAWAWNAAAWSVLVWYLLDSAMSLYWGFWPNAVLNTGFMALFAWPLWRLRYMKGW